MGERYTRLFSLPKNIYAAGAPVLIAAGALLKDNKIDRVVAQLKIKNIQDKEVKEVKVVVTACGTTGNKLGDVIFHNYINLSEKRDMEFGQKIPIVIPDNAAKLFAVEVAEVIFADGSVWNSNGQPWEQIPDQISLDEELGDAELVKQYKIKYSGKCIYTPKRESNGLWFCACGAVNGNSEDTCHMCSNKYESLRSDIDDPGELTQERNARLRAEVESVAEKNDLVLKVGSQYMEDDSITSLKTAIEKFSSIPGWKEADICKKECEGRLRYLRKKLFLKVGVLFIIVSVCIAAVTIVLTDVIPDINYKKGIKCREAGDYESAIEIFSDLGDYKNAKQQIPGTYYEKGKKLFAENNYDSAIEAYEAAGNYNDSKEQIAIIHYTKGEQLFSEGNYDAAIGEYEAAGSYGDSRDKISKVHYTIAEQLYSESDYDGALKQYEAAGDYGDSKDRVSVIYYAKGEKFCADKKYDDAIKAYKAAGNYKDSMVKYEQLSVKQGKIGDTVSFNNEDWVILDKKWDNALIIRLGSDIRRVYNSKREKTTWGECSLRKWLNEEFYSTFTEDEKNVIVAADYSGSSGNNTKDSIFVLSSEEAKEYFVRNENACPEYDEYAWLRTQGSNDHTAKVVKHIGDKFEVPDSEVDIERIVLPALWISID